MIEKTQVFPCVPAEEFFRLPGLYRRWEIEQVLEVDTEYLIQEAGEASDGTSLFMIFSRPHQPDLDGEKRR